jgi:hypothetical protein
MPPGRSHKGGLSIRGAVTYNSATIFGYQDKDGADGGLGGPNGDTYFKLNR